MQIFIVVTHLLGSGHLRRSINLARAFAAVDHSVTLVSGGLPVPQFSTDGVSVLQLPPVSSDGVDFKRLLQPDGSEVTSDYLASRQITMQQHLTTVQPAVIITELFPFGRRVLREEFLALLETATSLPEKPLVVASVRDILSPPSTPDKAQATDTIIDSFYDAVLVHSDASTTPLEKSWPVSDMLLTRLRYTGYVTEPNAVAVNSNMQGEEGEADGRGEIIVSAGGGAVGRQVFETAVESANGDKEHRWRILVGGTSADAEIKRLRKRCTAGSTIIEPARPDFRQLLLRADCSVSLCGYNTAIDLLQTGTPGVLVPFEEGGETEQRLRAESLAVKPSFIMLPMKDLTSDQLRESVAAARKVGRTRSPEIRFDGAAESVRIVSRLVEQHVK